MRPQPLDTDAVTELAAAKGINSVSELARRVRYSQSYLSRVLRGDRPAQPSLVVRLAETLEVEASSLLRKEPAA